LGLLSQGYVLGGYATPLWGCKNNRLRVKYFCYKGVFVGERKAPGGREGAFIFLEIT
jgi:hypothetical protein